MRNSNNAIVSQSTGYADAAAAGEYPQADINITVPDNCYTFTILDAYGDGISGDYGAGSYQIFADGALISGIEGGAFAGSDIRKFGVVTTLSNTQFESNKISVYPNPTKGLITINTENNVDVSISDITGKVVFTKNNVSNNEAINLVGLQNGVYFAKITAEGINEIKKIILN